MIGLGMGLIAHGNLSQSAGWYDNGAILDMDLAGDRHRWDGTSYFSLAELLTAIGGTEDVNGISIGAYDIPSAPQMVVNGNFDVDAASWAGFNGGTISVTGGVLTLAGNGGNIPGFQQALSLQKSHAYRFHGQMQYLGGFAPSWTVSSNSTLNGNGACHLTDSNPVMHDVESLFAANQATMYVGGRMVQNACVASSSYDAATVSEVLPFKNFEAAGITAIVKGRTPSTASGDKVVFEASDGSINSASGPQEFNRVRLLWEADNELRVTVSARGTEYANLLCGTVAPDTDFEVAFAVGQNQAYATQLASPLLVSDLTVEMPGLAKIYLKRQNASGSTFDGTLERVKIFPGTQVPRLIAQVNGIRTEGDSFMGGAQGVSLPSTLRTLMGREVYNTGVGGSDLDGVYSRVTLAANSPLLGLTHISWDGSENGLVTVELYLDRLADIIAALGHQKFGIIPTCTTYGQVDMTQDNAIRDGMLARWPNNVIDWRDWIPNTDGALDADKFANIGGGDTTHLSQLAMDYMALGIQDFITTRSI